MENDAFSLAAGHLAERVNTGEARGRVKRARLVNLLNRVHFHDGEIALSFLERGAGGSPLTVPARPLPCDGIELRCTWANPFPHSPDPDRHDLVGFSFSAGLERYFVPTSIVQWNPDGLSLGLPAEAFVVGARRTRRHRCQGVEAILHRGDTMLHGELSSFCASSLAVTLKQGSLDGHTGGLVRVELRRDGEVHFDGPCALIEQREVPGGRILVLEPPQTGITRQKAKSVRTDRRRPAPLPTVSFRHPLTGRLVALRASDVSGAGFAVEEDARHAVLFPGLVLPEARIEFMVGTALPCRVQVLHTSALAEGGSKAGFAILDMDPADHVRLCSTLHSVEDRGATISSSAVDLDALWDFFFEAGFLYPAKYASLKGQREDFKRLYEKLYHRSPSISRHVIYQDRGVIYGHVSMFRFYRRTWLLHHHAAIPSSRHRAGVVVMEQILRYLNEFHHLPAARMRYIAVYYRPDNRFANRVFGMTTRAMGDRTRNSLDAFAYLHVAAEGEAALPPGWSFEAATGADLEAFTRCYREHSGGLLAQGLDLDPDGAAADPELDREYAALGLTRGRRLYALRDGGEGPVAILAANRSDLGLNLSDLTNCIQCMVVAPARLDREALRASLRRAALDYPSHSASALVYPRTHAETVGLPYEKSYDLTILDMEHFGRYLEIFAKHTGSRSMVPRGTRGLA